MRTERRGTALLESLFALLVVSVAGLSLISLASACVERVRRVGIADRESAGASAFLEAVSMWSREELEQRLGRRSQGPFILEVQLGSPELFTITVSDSTGSHYLLSTQLYRENRSHRRG